MEKAVRLKAVIAKRRLLSLASGSTFGGVSKP